MIERIGLDVAMGLCFLRAVSYFCAAVSEPKNKTLPPKDGFYRGIAFFLCCACVFSVWAINRALYS